MDVAIITPEPGQHKTIGQTLLLLADRPADVQWVTWPQAGYAVPLELLQRFETSQTPTDPQPEPVAEQTSKRRGRPRKTVDDNTSEEE